MSYTRLNALNAEYTALRDEVIPKLLEAAYRAGYDDARWEFKEHGDVMPVSNSDWLDWCDRESERLGLNQGTIPVGAWIEEARKQS